MGVLSSLLCNTLHAAMNLCRSKGVVLVCRLITYIDDTCVISAYNMIIKCIAHAFELFSGRLTGDTMIVVIIISVIK